MTFAQQFRSDSQALAACCKARKQRRPVVQLASPTTPSADTVKSSSNDAAERRAQSPSWLMARTSDAPGPESGSLTLEYPLRSERPAAL